MTVRSTLPVNAGGGLIQVMRCLAGGAHKVPISGTTARNTISFNTFTRVIEIYSTVECYFQQGDNTVTATTSDNYLPATTGRLYALGGDRQAQATHIAVIQAAGGGTLHISEME